MRARADGGVAASGVRLCEAAREAGRMSEKRWRRRFVGKRRLSPETLMMGYGYDPSLSERSLKPPIFQTSTFVFRTAQDDVFALLDRCPHRGGTLSQGIVFGDSVACPLHNWTIGLGDGCAVAPDVGCVQRFSVRVEGDAVALDLAELGA